MTVWIVFRETVRHTDIDSVWTTKEDALHHAEVLHLNQGIGTLIEPYEVRSHDRSAAEEPG